MTYYLATDTTPPTTPEALLAACLTRAEIELDYLTACAEHGTPATAEGFTTYIAANFEPLD